MLEDTRTGDGSFFCDVPDDEKGDVVFLCEPQKHAGRLADLGNTARCRGYTRIVHGLNRIDDHHLRFFLQNHLGDCVKIGLAVEFQVAADRSDPLCPEPDLAQRFLAGHIQNGMACIRNVLCDLQQQGRFADSRISADQNERPLHDPAAKHTVKLRKARGNARFILCFDGGERNRAVPDIAAGISEADSSARSCRPRGRHRADRFLYHGVPCPHS